MIFGQSTKYNVKNIFLEKSFKKCEETIVSPDQQYEILILLHV